MTERVNITLPESLLAEVDAAAVAEHTSRSGYVRAAVLSRLHGSAGTQPPVAAEARAAYGLAEAASAPAPRGASRPGPPPADVLLDRLRSFCAARDDIRAALVFGSAASGTAGPLSDVDVAVLLPDEWNASRRVALQGELADRLSAALGVTRVDVVVLNDAAPALAYRATWDGLVAWGADDPALAHAKVRAFSEYQDFVPVLDELGRALRERIDDGSFGR